MSDEIDMTPQGHNDVVDYYRFGSKVQRGIDRQNRKRWKHWVKIAALLAFMIGSTIGYFAYAIITGG